MLPMKNWMRESTVIENLLQEHLGSQAMRQRGFSHSGFSNKCWWNISARRTTIHIAYGCFWYLNCGAARVLIINLQQWLRATFGSKALLPAPSSCRAARGTPADTTG